MIFVILHLQNVPLDKVRLTDGCFSDRRALVKRYVQHFDVDRLMHNFRVNAGITSNAAPLGGWEDPTCGLRGHFVGHFLSACARFAYADKDADLTAKAEQIIEIMQACVEPNGYLSAFEEEKLDVLELEENRGVWAPYYTLHKIMQGLVDCYSLLGSKEALSSATRLGLYIHERFEKLPYWKIDGVLRCTKHNPTNEFGGIGDTLYTLYSITKEAKLLELAKLFDREYFLGNMQNRNDVLADLHANTHLPMILAAMHRYDISGEEVYKTASENFYDFLISRTFANGNTSAKAAHPMKGKCSEKAEHWGNAWDLSDALTGEESESCCAHNTERILEYFARWNGSVQYFHHLESLKYNAILNCASAQTGLSQYHQPMGKNVQKKFSSPFDTFWCCTASGVEAFSEIQKNIWFKDEKTVLLNAYISSVFLWDEIGVTVTQRSEYPEKGITTLHIETKEPADFRLLLKEKTVRSVTINGQSVSLHKEAGYVVLERKFCNQDCIVIDIRAELRLEYLIGNEGVAAVKYGEILLAQVGSFVSLDGITNENINDKLVRLNEQALVFGFADDVYPDARLIPLFRVEDQTYTVYTSCASLKNLRVK